MAPSSSAALQQRQNCYETTHTYEGKNLYVRMELLTERNYQKWERFRASTEDLFGDRGTFRVLLESAQEGTIDSTFPYETVKYTTGFTEEEYDEFKKTAAKISEKTCKALLGTRVGCQGLYCVPSSHHFIVYVTNDSHFSIDAVDELPTSKTTLKQYHHMYQKILIVMGSNFFPGRNFFENRGIFRNPHWTFQGKYAGLSMLLHGMTGAVAQQFYPKRKWMIVYPVGSMQVILKNTLRRSEGYALEDVHYRSWICIEEHTIDKGRDITELETKPTERQSKVNCIRVEALERIFKSS